MDTVPLEEATRHLQRHAPFPMNIDACGSASSLDQLDDPQLLTLFFSGDENAFAALIRRHRPAMLTYGIYMLRSNFHAEDVVQDVCLQAWHHLEKLNDVERLRPWLLTMVHNRAVDYLRRENANQKICPPLQAMTCATNIDRWALINDLQSALLTLPRRQAQCWILREYVGLSYDGIAESLETNATVVRGLLARARSGLRAALSES